MRKKTSTKKAKRERGIEAYPSLGDQVEIWAEQSVESQNDAQQLALISMLQTISTSADPEAMTNAFMYAVFKHCDHLHDEAIKCIVEAGREDHAVAVTARGKGETDAK